MKQTAKKIMGILRGRKRSRLRPHASDIPHGATVLVHIGKCGGRTVRNGLANARSNTNVWEIHIRKPPFRDDLRYIIIARNPISRLASAFRWRYRIVVEEGSQKDRFPEEFEVLVKYGSLNAIAEALYFPNGSPNKEAHKEIRKIHHIKEDIAFYTSELLRKCSPEQITAVLMQENLDADIERVFGYKNELVAHKNPATESDSHLSRVARGNLTRFFVDDYESLTRLYCWGKISREMFHEAVF